MQEHVRQHRHARPLSHREVEKLQKFLKDYGYEERFKNLEDAVAEILSILKEKEVVESNNQ